MDSNTGDVVDRIFLKGCYIVKDHVKKMENITRRKNVNVRKQSFRFEHKVTLCRKRAIDAPNVIQLNFII